MRDGDEGTVLRDLTMLALLAFVVLVALMIRYMNPPTEGEEAAKAAGNLIVEARWPDDLDVDVDLWTLAPGDRPVGYTNKHGAVFDLLRDDLGTESDATGLNYEFAFCRGAPAGEYIVNVHLYSNRMLASAVPVFVMVSMPSDTAPTVMVWQETVTLRHVGDQITVVRFTLDEAGRVVAGSVHNLPMALR